MADEQDTLLTPENTPPIATDEDEAPEGEAPPSEEASEEEPVEGEEGDDEDQETIEVEIGGKKFLVPKAVEEHLLREEDYTQKTQTLAEQRRELEAHQERVNEAAQVREAVLDDISVIRGIDATLQEYNRIDWPAYHLQNPQAAGYHYMQFQELQGQRQQAAYALNEKMQHVSTQQAEARNQAIDKSVTALTKPDPEYGWPGYSATHMERLTDAAKREFGFSDRQLQTIIDPISIKTLNCAVLWKQAMRKAAAKPKGPTVEAQPVKQIPTHRGRSGSSSSGDNKSVDQWVADERRRIAAKNAANGSRPRNL